MRRITMGVIIFVMRSFKHYLLIVAISLLPFVFILTTRDLAHTHDGGVHLPRIAAYVKALLDGHFPVRWAGDLNYGYGLPLFNFIYQTPYFLASLFVLSGVSLVLSFKLILIISFILSGIFMYSFAKELLKDDAKALLVAVFYQFAPFRLIEIFTRGSIGSLYAYAFLPLVLYGITRKSFLITTASTALLIVSHNALSLIFFSICLLFTFLFAKRKMFFALFIGLALSAFYWIPAVLEHKYTYGDLYMKNVYLDHFPPLLHFFIPNLTNNPDLNTANISMQFGVFHALAIALSIFFLQKNKTKKLMLFSLFLVAISIFFMQPVSSFFWENLSLLRQFQFPWRLLAIPVFATSILSLSYFSFFKKRSLIWVLIALTVFSTAAYWYPPEGFDRKIDEQNYWNYPLNTTYFGETDVIWSAGPAKAYPKEKIEVISGQAAISNFTKITQKHSYVVDAQTPVQLVDNTQFFPGWRVFVDKTQVPIQFQDANHRGLMVFDVPQGVHQVRAVFGESKIRLAADLISLGAALFLWTKRKSLSRS